MNGHFYIEVENDEGEIQCFNEAVLAEALQRAREFGHVLRAAAFVCQYGCGQLHPLKIEEWEAIEKVFGDRDFSSDSECPLPNSHEDVARWWDDSTLGARESMLKGDDRCPTNSDMEKWFDELDEDTQEAVFQALATKNLEITE